MNTLSEILRGYAHIMSDPAHLAAEVSLMVLIDGLFLGLIWPLFRRRLDHTVDRRIRAEHAVLDAEHGVEHGPDGAVQRTNRVV